jgi:hypothetical protein
LYTGNTDIRRQFDGLAAMVTNQLQLQAHTGGVSPAKFEESYFLEQPTVWLSLGSPD